MFFYFSKVDMGHISDIWCVTYNDNLKKMRKKVGVEYYSSHGIRFHNISAMYDAGIIEKEI